MKRIIVLTALAITGSFLFSGNAMAWDELISNDTPQIKQSGDVSIDGTIMWRTASKYYDSGSNSQDLANDMTSMSIPLRGRYGINEYVQTFAIVQIVSNDNGVDTNTGLGDLWLGAKWAVRPDGLFTIRGALDIPTGDDKNNLGRTGGFGLDAGFMTGIINGPIDLKGQFGIRYNAEDADTKIEPGTCLYLDGKAGLNLSKQFSGNVGLEFMSWAEGKTNNVKDKSSEVNWLEMSLGIAYRFDTTYMLFVDGTYVVLGKNTPLSIGGIAGIKYRY